MEEARCAEDDEAGYGFSTLISQTISVTGHLLHTQGSGQPRPLMEEQLGARALITAVSFIQRGLWSSARSAELSLAKVVHWAHLAFQVIPSLLSSLGLTIPRFSV